MTRSNVKRKVKIAQLKISTPYNVKRLTNGYEWPYNVQEQDNIASEFIEMIHSASSTYSQSEYDNDYTERNPLSKSFFKELLVELDEMIEKMKIQEYDEIVNKYL